MGIIPCVFLLAIYAVMVLCHVVKTIRNEGG
jgi:hypothetical protein